MTSYGCERYFLIFRPFPYLASAHLVFKPQLKYYPQLTATSTIINNIGGVYIVCSPWSPWSPWWPFRYLLWVGLVLLLHSFRSRATSWVTPTPAMSSFICWCHVFLGHPRRLVPGIANYITLRVTLFASLIWTYRNQRRRRSAELRWSAKGVLCVECLRFACDPVSCVHIIHVLYIPSEKQTTNSEGKPNSHFGCAEALWVVLETINIILSGWSSRDKNDFSLINYLSA